MKALCFFITKNILSTLSLKQILNEAPSHRQHTQICAELCAQKSVQKTDRVYRLITRSMRKTERCGKEHWKAQFKHSLTVPYLSMLGADKGVVAAGE